MAETNRLHDLLARSARTVPDRPAVVDPGRGVVTYGGLHAAARSIADLLRTAGVEPGARVGICAPKSAGVVAGLFGVLEAGAAYVPVDPTAPARRSALIFDNCSVAALIVDRGLLAGLEAELETRVEVAGEIDVAGVEGLDLVLARATRRTPDEFPVPPGLAYILYTSGSTGVPKGVMHSHATALSFIDWCAGELEPTHEDVFSSHAPFHFDLSIFDLFVSIGHGAALVIVGEDCGKQPPKLAQLIADERITIWYSTPSVLRLLVEFGKLDAHDCSSLRLVLYAGEVFPPKHQHALRAHWPSPTYYNLYGPTETNVCTAARVDEVPADDGGAISIGRVCSGDRVRVVDEHGTDVARGAEGELVVAGGSVMLGYWNLPEQNTRAFLDDPDGTRWYRTGDLVAEQEDGELLFHGRRDRMVKRRGYRIELGEIEAAMHRHEHVTEAAVIAVQNEDGVVIKAFVNWTGDGKPSTIALKGFASKNLPAYMIPDRIAVLPSLPKTSTDKIDYRKLAETP